MTKNVWSKKHEAKSNLQIKTLSLFFSKYKILLRINVNVCTWNVLTENKCLDCVYIIRWCIEIRVFQTNRFMDGEETYRFRKATQIDRLRMLFLVWKTSKAVLLTKDKRKKKTFPFIFHTFYFFYFGNTDENAINVGKCTYSEL